MENWLEQLHALLVDREPAILVTVAAVRGSAPREPGARMIVTRDHSYGTIGGGQLEFRCIRQACVQLGDTDSAASRQQRFTLGPDCGQCCGGVVDVWFERISHADLDWLAPALDASKHGKAIGRVSLRQPENRVSRVITAAETVVFSSGDFAAHRPYRDAAAALVRKSATTRADVIALNETMRMPVLVDCTAASQWTIAIFGAGHVGTAVGDALRLLPATSCVIDTRPEQINRVRARGISTKLTDNPLTALDRLPDGADIVVMTHDHGLDYRLIEKALAARRFGYVGLIGSRSKRRRFEKRLRQAGLTDANLAALTCPIGIASIDGKQPFEIAIALSAELIARRQASLVDVQDDQQSGDERLA
ncbi:MAG: xanthine dehydrogenase accessory protein XdhC [Pseudomonadota bacterium]